MIEIGYEWQWQQIEFTSKIIHIYLCSNMDREYIAGIQSSIVNVSII